MPSQPDVPGALKRSDASANSESRSPENSFVRFAGRLSASRWRALRRHARNCGAGNGRNALLLAAYGLVLARFSRSRRFLITLMLSSVDRRARGLQRLFGNLSTTMLLDMDMNVQEQTGNGARFAQMAQDVSRRLLEHLPHGALFSGLDVAQELHRRSLKVEICLCLALLLLRNWLSIIFYRSRSKASAATPFAFSSVITSRTSRGEGLLPHHHTAGAEYSCIKVPQTWMDLQVSEERVNDAHGEDSLEDLVYGFDVKRGVFAPGIPELIVQAFTSVLEKLSCSRYAWTEPSTRLFRKVQPAVPVDAPAPLPYHFLHDGFVRSAKQRPQRMAIQEAAADGKALTYAQAERASAALALTLKALFTPPGQRAQEHGEGIPVVAVLMAKGAWQIVSVLAILRAGGAYMPIDPHVTPVARVKNLLSMSRAVAVLSNARSLSLLGKDWRESDELTAPVVDVDRVIMQALESPNRFLVPPVRHTPTALAYLLYTSGSTGTPKGVSCHHLGAVNTCDHLNEKFAIGSGDKTFGISSLSFDLSVYDIFGILAAGGCVVVPRQSGQVMWERDRPATQNALPSNSLVNPADWLAALWRHRVSVWNTVPAFVELLVAQCEGSGQSLPSCLRVVMMSGDWIPLSLTDRLLAVAHPDSLAAGLRVVSLGGATEAAIWSNMYQIHPRMQLLPDGRANTASNMGEWNSIPYGQPLRNQTMYVLNDATMEHCEPWVTGVIYIGGVGVALGYFRDAERTGRQFVEHPRTGERLFRTGDLGRLRPCGYLEILGQAC